MPEPACGGRVESLTGRDTIPAILSSGYVIPRSVLKKLGNPDVLKQLNEATDA